MKDCHVKVLSRECPYCTRRLDMHTEEYVGFYITHIDYTCGGCGYAASAQVRTTSRPPEEKSDVSSG